LPSPSASSPSRSASLAYQKPSAWAPVGGAALTGIILGFFAISVTVIVTLGWIVLGVIAAEDSTPTPIPL